MFVLGEMRRYLTKESNEDRKLRELISLLIYWINEELADQRIVVRNLQEDLYDGQILQKLIEKLAGIRIEVPEVTQSEEGQKKKLDLVVQTVNRIISPADQPKWDAELIHSKDIVAIMQILVSMVLHFRAPIRLPEHVSVKMLVVSKHQGHSRSEFITEKLTTTQGELGLKGERDAFDTLFDYGPDKLSHVKTSLLAFCNKHLNKINLEVCLVSTFALVHND
uniref:Calponin-homology (CH) domain-containing protein n=1 Tax=Angiostrongylus cantonensis TaxID=6313 RepID=A0A0K0D070_ANGCA